MLVLDFDEIKKNKNTHIILTLILNSDVYFERF